MSNLVGLGIIVAILLVGVYIVKSFSELGRKIDSIKDEEVRKKTIREIEKRIKSKKG